MNNLVDTSVCSYKSVWIQQYICTMEYNAKTHYFYLFGMSTSNLCTIQREPQPLRYCRFTGEALDPGGTPALALPLLDLNRPYFDEVLMRGGMLRLDPSSAVMEGLYCLCHRVTTYIQTLLVYSKEYILILRFRYWLYRACPLHQ